MQGYGYPLNQFQVKDCEIILSVSEKFKDHVNSWTNKHSFGYQPVSTAKAYYFYF